MMGTGQSAVTKDNKAYKESKRKFQDNVLAMDYSKKRKRKKKKNKVDAAAAELIKDVKSKKES